MGIDITEQRRMMAIEAYYMQQRKYMRGEKSVWGRPVKEDQDVRGRASQPATDGTEQRVSGDELEEEGRTDE